MRDCVGRIELREERSKSGLDLNDAREESEWGGGGGGFEEIIDESMP